MDSLEQPLSNTSLSPPRLYDREPHFDGLAISMVWRCRCGIVGRPSVLTNIGMLLR